MDLISLIERNMGILLEQSGEKLIPLDPCRIYCTVPSSFETLEFFHSHVRI